MIPTVNASPSALIMSALESSSGAGRNAFFNLSYVHFPKHLDPKKNRAEVALAIFQTNAVAAGENVGIFPGMARLNHGCAAAFNVVYNWREAENALFIRAVKDIREGEVRPRCSAAVISCIDKMTHSGIIDYVYGYKKVQRTKKVSVRNFFTFRQLVKSREEPSFQSNMASFALVAFAP